MTQNSGDVEPSATPLGFRAARAVRRAFGIDREARWNAEYAAGTWSRLRNLDEMAHHSVLAGYFARLKPGGSLLDVGCGEGVFQEELRGCYSRYLGTDFAEPVKQASARADARTEFVTADMNDFTTTERFDAVVFNESIYYHHDPIAGVQRYEQFLAPDGVFLISMHCKERNNTLWAQLDCRYDVLDAVLLENAQGTRWRVKALARRAAGAATA